MTVVLNLGGTAADMVGIFCHSEFREFLREDLVQQIKKRFLAGNLKIVGHTPIPEEVPVSEQSENPAHAQTSVSAIGPRLA